MFVKKNPDRKKKCLWRYLGWTWRQCALTVSYVIFLLFPLWLCFLSHAISPYLHGKLINWTVAFYSSFCCTVLPRILNILIFMNRQGCFSHLYLSIIFYAFSYIIIHHCLCILFNQSLLFCCLCGTAKICFNKISMDFVRLSKLWVVRLYIVIL